MPTINITVTGNNNISCNKTHLSFGSHVKWKCNQGHTFAVDFGEISPFSQTSYHGKKPAGSAYAETSSNQVIANATPVGYPLRFKYTVAVYLSGADEILISDPEVIIDP